jgi:hypothetical protein
MKQVLKYPGAKARLAKWICGYIPNHKVYIEPYAGSLAVLFNKSKAHIETVNDLNKDVVNFFKVLRDHNEELQKLIYNTPYAREEYERAYEKTDNPIEADRRFCVRCWQGFGCSNRYKNGWKNGQQTRSPNPSRAWATLPDTINIAQERLMGVQIENLPALEILDRYDTADVFAYLDPPYMKGTRKGYLYLQEMTDKDHLLLLEAVVKHPGRFLISGYDNDLYSFYLSGKKWHKTSKQSQVEQGLKRTETLWMNYII